MGLKRRNPTRIPLLTPHEMLAAMVVHPTATANQQAKTVARVSSEERRRLIAVAAYRYAESVGFSSDPVANWLHAEREVDAALERKAS
jgi:Protein of unknown function (DUF2934)